MSFKEEVHDGNVKPQQSAQKSMVNNQCLNHDLYSDSRFIMVNNGESDLYG